jgi:predicted kinase
MVSPNWKARRGHGRAVAPTCHHVAGRAVDEDDHNSIANARCRWQASRLVVADELTGCVVVSGMPGAGKSTVSALAARSLPRAAQVKGDDLNQMIMSGAVWFMGEPRDEARRQYELCKRNMCALANNFVDFGFTVFMDTVVQDRAMLEFLLALMSPRPVRLVTLAPGVDVCGQRNAARHPDERFAFDRYRELDADMRSELAGVGWWFDTSALTPAATAGQLVREAARRAPPMRGRWDAGLAHIE